MKVDIFFVASREDPNGLAALKGIVQRTLENTAETITIVIASEGSEDLVTDFSIEDQARLKYTHGTYKNYCDAVLNAKERGLFEGDLLFLVSPGDDVEITTDTIAIFYENQRISQAGFIISNHYEYISEAPDAEPVLQKLKPGYDPSNVIVPGRSNNPALFCHGPLLAVSKPFINNRVFDTEVNYGADYAVRMGVLAQGGKLYTVPRPTYTFRRGEPFYPGQGLQRKFESQKKEKMSRHFSYTQDPARFEWGPISFQKYLKDIGAFLPDSYFTRKVPVDPTLGNGISFVLPTYNRAYLIHYAIESVIEVRKRVDSFIPIELIIVDNGNDNTPNVVAPYVQQYPDLVKFYKVFGMTLGGARNFGVQKAWNRIIGQLDSDDVLIGDPVTKIVRQFDRTGAAAVIGIYQTAARDSETGELTLDNQIITHDEYLCDQNNPLLQMCIPGPGAPRYYRKEAILASGGYPDLLYGEDAALSDQMLKLGFIIERNMDEANYIAVRHSANTDSEELGSDILLRKNYAKYSFKISIIEELKHLVLSNTYYHKYNNRVGF